MYSFLGDDNFELINFVQVIIKLGYMIAVSKNFIIFVPNSL